MGSRYHEVAHAPDVETAGEEELRAAAHLYDALCDALHAARATTARAIPMVWIQRGLTGRGRIHIKANVSNHGGQTICGQSIKSGRIVHRTPGRECATCMAILDLAEHPDQQE
jgi:hypothetical protein